MKYHPNKKITIKPSNIEGLGAFATEDLKKGEDLGYTHVTSPITDLFPQDMIRIEWGSRINHNPNPNIELLRHKELTLYREDISTQGDYVGATELYPVKIVYYKAFALRDIKKGEELCNDYGADGENNCPCGQDYVDEL